jgi:hypothetical protein
MKIRKSLNRAMVCATLLTYTGAAGAWAQHAAVRSRVTQAVDDAVTVRLQGNVHPLAKPQFDQGALPDSQPLTRMLLVLQRSQEQELGLRQLLDAQVTKNSGSYHAWLSPDQFGKQFGPSDSDVQAITDWLTKQGFTIRKLAAGKTAIEFDGNVAQVRNAFHTEIHRFVVNGETRFANVSDPAIPQALSQVVAGVAALHNFPKHSYIVKSGLYRRYKDTGKLEPLFTFGSPVNYALGPGDFRTIYNIPPTADGSGQAIAIIADSNINTADINSYRTMFGLPAYPASCATPPTTGCLNVIVNGPDPGLNGDEVEADLDTQLVGGVAPNAAIYLVVTEPTLSNPGQVSQGVDLSALYAVDNNLAPVISDSFGECEAGMLTAGNQFYDALWEQAAAQGITVAVATGDDGPAACDPSTDPNAATQGLNVSGLASTPFNVAVGGTDFDPTSTTTSVSTYWKPNTTGDVINSAIMYIPETTWDDSPCAASYPTACTTLDTSGADISAGSGGPSNCVLGTAQSNGNITCPTSSSFPNGGYLKPSFQAGITPADSLRDIPDVSFFASNGGLPTGGAGVAYVICQSDTNPQGSTTPTGAPCSLASPYTDFTLVGGTSAATPAFAAVMAMVNQSQGRQGNANYVLYKLANNTTYTGGSCQSSVGQTPAGGCVFNDVSKGNNSVACDGGTPNCSNTSTATGQFGVLVCNSPGCNNSNYPNSTGVPAFKAASGYDLATGLGSINVGNLLTSWTSAIRTATTTTLTSPSGGSPSGTNFTASVSVSPTPTGPVEDVSLIALASDKETVLGSYGPFALSGGTASVSTNLLPPGTTYVEGSYGGDASLGASTSSPVALSSAVSGAGQTSKLTVFYVGFNSSNAPTTPTTSSQNFVYGSGNGYILQVVVTGSSGNFTTACAFNPPATKPSIPCPTGTIQLFDGGQPLKDFTQSGTATNQASLNNQGFAEDQPINVNAGTHSITATYSGDQNYAATTSSNTLSITITQASTTTTVAPSLSSITPGTTVTLTATVGSTSGSPQGPTGTVTFTSNGNTIGTGTCTPTGPTSTTGASCTASLTTAISSLYPPPSGRPGTPNFPRIPVIVALLSLLLFLLGLRFVPQTRKRAYTYAGLLVIALLVGVVAGCGGGGGGSSGGSGTRTIGAAYGGDTNYKASTATPVPIIVQ